jgi:hypothetical protein
MGVPENFLKDLEAEGPVPEYLKKALVSEVDFIRDTMVVVNHSVSAFIDTAIMLVADLEDKETDNT